MDISSILNPTETASTSRSSKFMNEAIISMYYDVRDRLRKRTENTSYEQFFEENDNEAEPDPDDLLPYNPPPQQVSNETNSGHGESSRQQKPNRNQPRKNLSREQNSQRFSTSAHTESNENHFEVSHESSNSCREGKLNAKSEPKYSSCMGDNGNSESSAHGGECLGRRITLQRSKEGGWVAITHPCAPQTCTLSGSEQSRVHTSEIHTEPLPRKPFHVVSSNCQKIVIRTGRGTTPRASPEWKLLESESTIYHHRSCEKSGQTVDEGIPCSCQVNILERIRSSHMKRKVYKRALPTSRQCILDPKRPSRSRSIESSIESKRCISDWLSLDSFLVVFGFFSTKDLAQMQLISPTLQRYIQESCGALLNYLPPAAFKFERMKNERPLYSLHRRLYSPYKVFVYFTAYKTVAARCQYPFWTFGLVDIDPHAPELTVLPNQWKFSGIKLWSQRSSNGADGRWRLNHAKYNKLKSSKVARTALRDWCLKLKRGKHIAVKHLDVYANAEESWWEAQIWHLWREADKPDSVKVYDPLGQTVLEIAPDDLLSHFQKNPTHILDSLWPSKEVCAICHRKKGALATFFQCRLEFGHRQKPPASLG